MNRVKSFDQLVSEGILYEGPNSQSCTSSLCTTVLPTISKVTELVIAYNPQSPAQDLVKILSEVDKLQKMVSDAIRAATPRPAAGAELDWTKKPLAPIFILRLKDKYPQLEDKYHELWYKAAARQPSFTYGGAIVIFKTYCNRENPKLMLEDHEYDNELTEEQINKL